MKAVVIGGSGLLGAWLVERLRAHGHTVSAAARRAVAPDVISLPVNDAESARRWIEAERPDWVLYAAGLTWAEQCEREPLLAYQENVERPLAFARWSAATASRFVFASSAYVFDGEKASTSSAEPTSPVSVYGHTKAQGENALAELLGEKLLCARFVWLFGPERHGKNFAYRVASELGNHQSLTCPIELKGQPTYAPDAAEAIVRLLENAAHGIAHVVGDEICNRVEFARHLAKGFGWDESQVQGRSVDELGERLRRPKNAVLTPTTIPGRFRFRNTVESIADFRRHLATNDRWKPVPTGDAHPLEGL